MRQDRIARLRQLLEDRKLDAVLLAGSASLRYFCGFSGSDGALMVSADSVIFLTDSRYTSQAGQEVVADHIRQYSAKVEGIAGLIGEQGWRRVGFEAEVVSFALAQRLRGQAPQDCDWQPLGQEVQALRQRKDAEEIRLMAAAARLAANAFEEIRPAIRPGVTERELALALEFAMKRRGAEDKSFDFIVASGERGALPHGVASGRKLAAGELITFDFGARWQGYCSDETVTLALGGVPAQLEEVYHVVLAAQRLALEQVRPGVALRELDRVARDHIAASGYGPFFGHGLGHGVGLEVHEQPLVSGRSEAVAEIDMVFTIEPGIYLPGAGGVRIEDTIQVTADGYRRLTCLPKEYSVLPV